MVDKIHGRNKKNQCSIEDLHPGIECTVSGTITDINEMRKFDRKNGSIGRVVNLELTDSTGSCGLVLWDKDVELINNKSIKIGTKLKLVNAYTKEGYSGLEVNIGRWSILEIEPDDFPDFSHKQSINQNKIKGTIVEIEPTRSFFKDDGEFGFVTNIKIKDKDNVKQLTLWNEKVKEIQGLKQGDQIEINNIDIKQKNGKKEIHVNGKGIIIKC